VGRVRRVADPVRLGGRPVVPADDQFAFANTFLGEAATATTLEYPGSASGSPVTTPALYHHPESFGFKTIPIESAQTGSLVLYDGLGGILIETRRSDSEPWTKQVLYPSAASGGRLTLSDPTIPGKAAPRVLVKEKLEIR
jgi:hypothetical protein